MSSNRPSNIRKVRVYLDFDGTLTGMAGQDSLNAFKDYIKEQNLDPEKIPVAAYTNFLNSQSGKASQLIPGGALFLHWLLSNPHAFEPVIVSRKQRELIQMTLEHAEIHGDIEIISNNSEPNKLKLIDTYELTHPVSGSRLVIDDDARECEKINTALSAQKAAQKATAQQSPLLGPSALPQTAQPETELINPRCGELNPAEVKLKIREMSLKLNPGIQFNETGSMVNPEHRRIGGERSGAIDIKKSKLTLQEFLDLQSAVDETTLKNRINTKNNNSDMLPLIEALMDGNAELALWLIKNGADIPLADSSGFNCLALAIRIREKEHLDENPELLILTLLEKRARIENEQTSNSLDNITNMEYREKIKLELGNYSRDFLDLNNLNIPFSKVITEFKDPQNSNTKDLLMRLISNPMDHSWVKEILDKLKSKEGRNELVQLKKNIIETMKIYGREEWVKELEYQRPEKASRMTFNFFSAAKNNKDIAIKKDCALYYILNQGTSNANSKQHGDEQAPTKHMKELIKLLDAQSKQNQESPRPPI